MWGDFIKSAAALATERAQTLATQSLSTASQLLERLDGMGAALEGEENESGHNSEPDNIEGTEKTESLEDAQFASFTQKKEGGDQSPSDSPANFSNKNLKQEKLSNADPIIDIPAAMATPKKQARPSSQSLAATPEPPANPSSDNLAGLTSSTVSPQKPAQKPVDIKKYQAKIRKLEKEKAELEQETSSLQLSVASLSKELQTVLADKDAIALQYSEQKQGLIEQISLLKAEQSHAESQFTSQLSAMSEQYETKLTALKDDYETKFSDLRKKFQAQEEELLVLQLKKDGQRNAENDQAELEKKLKELTAQCKRMLETYQTLQHEHEDLQLEAQQKDEEISRLSTLCNEKEEEIKGLQEAHASTTSRLDQVEREHLSLLDSNAELVKGYNEAISQLSGKGNEIADLIKQNQVQAGELSNLQLQYKGVVEMSSQLHEDVVKSTSLSGDLQAKLLLAQQLLEAQEFENKELKEQYNLIVQRVDAKEAEPLSSMAKDSEGDSAPAVTTNKAGKKKKNKKRTGTDIYSINIGSDKGNTAADETKPADPADPPFVHDTEVTATSLADSLSTNIAALEAQYEELLVKYNELVESHSNLQNKYDAKENDYHILIEQLSQSEQVRNSLSHEIEKIRHDYNHLSDQHRELANSQSESASMLASLDDMQKENFDSKEKLNALEAAYATLQSNYDELKEYYNSLEEKGTEHNVIVEELDKRNEDLASQLSGTQKMIESKNEEYAILQRALEESKLQCQQLVADMETIKLSGKEEENEAMVILQTDLQHTKDLLEELTLKNIDLEQKHDLALEQCASLQERNTSFLEDLSHLESEYTLSLQAISSLEEANKSLLRENKELESRCESLAETVSKLTIEVSQLQSTVSSVDNFSLLQQQYFSLQEEFASLKENSEQLKKAKLEVETSLEKHIDKYNALSTDFNHMKEIESTQKREIEQLKGGIEVLQAKSSATEELVKHAEVVSCQLAAKEKDVQKLKEQCNALTSQLDSAVEESNKLQQLLSTKQTDLSASQANLSQQVSQHDALLAQYNDSQSLVQSLTKQHHEIKQALQNLSNQHSALQLQYKEATASLDQSKQDLNAVQSKHSDLLTRFNKLERDNQYINQQYMSLLNQTNDKASSLKEEMEILESSKWDLLTQIDQMKQGSRKLQQTIDQLQSELTQTKQQMQSVDLKKKKDLEVLKKQNETINALQQKVFQLEQERTTAPQLNSVSAQIDPEEHQQLKEELNALQAEYDKAQKIVSEQVTNFEKNVKSLSEVNTVLSDEKQSLLQQVEVLKKEMEDINLAYEKAQKDHGQKVVELNHLVAKYQENILSHAPRLETPTENHAEEVKKLQVQINGLAHEKKEMMQQIEELSQRLSNAYEQTRSGPPPALSSHTLQQEEDDIEIGRMLVDREKKASIGSQVYVVQGWNLIRQNCPGVLVHHLPDRPPRLSLAAQAALVYGLFLQIVVVYQYKTCG